MLWKNMNSFKSKLLHFQKKTCVSWKACFVGVIFMYQEVCCVLCFACHQSLAHASEGWLICVCVVGTYSCYRNKA
jgi:hypothetical protein